MADSEYEGEVIEITVELLLEQAKKDANREAIALLTEMLNERARRLH